MNARVKAVIRKDIQSIRAYESKNAKGLIKLDAMENPHATPPEILNEWKQNIDLLQVNRYPDSEATALRTAIAKNHQCTIDNILLGNGSDELIQLLILACCGPKDKVLSFEPSFVMYKMAALFASVEYCAIPLTKDYTIPLEQTLEQIKRHQPKLIFISHPNNPTGNLFDLPTIEAILQTAQGLVVIDEAYAPFSTHSYLDQYADYPNIVILRTLSKIGFAGLRLGYAIAQTPWIVELNKVRMPYNINSATQHFIQSYLVKSQTYEDQIDDIIKARSALSQSLNELAVVATVYPSETNFLLVKINPTHCAEKVYQHLINQGILVKCLHHIHPLLKQCLRISVGQSHENKTLIDALKCLS